MNKHRKWKFIIRLFATVLSAVCDCVCGGGGGVCVWVGGGGCAYVGAMQPKNIDGEKSLLTNVSKGELFSGS